MKTKLPILTTVLALVLGLALPPPGFAKEKKSPTPTPTISSAPTAVAKKARTLPYHGKVAAVDAAAGTFTIGKRTFKVTDHTTITKDGAAASMSDIAPGQMVGGGYLKQDDGTLEAKSVKIRTTTPATDTAKKK